VFRYASRTFTAWPGDLFAIASFLAFLARRRSWVFLRPSQVCSRKRVSRRYQRSGPTCRFARRASDPIDFRRADRSPGGKSANQKASAGDFLFYATFDFWASLPSAIRIPQLVEATGPILPRALPLAGLWARICASESGSTPTESSASGIPRIAFHCELARPYPLMGLNACADYESARSPSLQRIDGADALSA